MKKNLKNSRKLKFLNRDMLKYFALIFMFLGHFLLYTSRELHCFGIRGIPLQILMYGEFVAPPIFFFFVSEGYRFTRSKKQYVLRLLILAIVTQFAYVLCHELRFDWNAFFSSWNVIITLFLGLLALLIWEKDYALPIRMLLVWGCTVLSVVLDAEWQVTGILLIWTFYILRHYPMTRVIVYELLVLVDCLWIVGMDIGVSLLKCMVVYTIPILLITFFYNGKKGKYPKVSKWVFYVFYPAHLLLIYFVRLITG